VKRVAWINGAAFLGALGLAAALAPGQKRIPVVQGAAAGSTASMHVRRVPLPEGGFALLDSTGYPVPLRPYQRIVSTSIVTDRLLVELCEPDRVLAFSATGMHESPWAYQYAGKASVEGLGALEPLISLKPDLVLMSRFGGPGRVAKLRAAGIEVFDLGELHGVSTLVPITHWIGELVGHPARAARFVYSFERRFAAVAATLGKRPRRRALYVAAIGPTLIGGTIGTSYHDVMVAAGLVDVAAEQFKDWPQYSAEQLMALDPELLVTKEGMGNALCAHPGLEHLAACAPGHVIELPAGMIEDPGPTMLDTAELLFERAYPSEASRK
jgi:iron complex transport system substrate-binding protein